jgi:hypothetical protein
MWQIIVAPAVAALALLYLIRRLAGVWRRSGSSQCSCAGCTKCPAGLADRGADEHPGEVE